MDIATPTATPTPGPATPISDTRKRPRDDKPAPQPRPAPPRSTPVPAGTGGRSTPVPTNSKTQPPPPTQQYQRIKPPPVQPSDLIIVPRTPTTHPANFEESAKIPLNADKPFAKSEASGGGGGVDDANAGAGEQQLYFTDDHPQNRRGFKYAYCAATPGLYPALQYTSAELAPFHASLSLFDRAPTTALSLQNRLAVSTAKGFVSARADVCMRTGHWYYEVRVDRANDGTGAHVRVGLSRREASLDAPVGFDGYGYGLRDVGGQKVHLSRPAAFMNEHITSGDVLGFHVYLPPAPKLPQDGVWRDRIAIKYKGQLYFETLEYQPTKEMEDLIVPLPEESGKAKKKAPVVIAELPGSFVRVYKNGEYMGEAFRDLSSFWPPHSKQHQLSSRAAAGAAAAAVSPDDGMLGYFPTASVFRGGMATFNFGPDFACLPADIGERLARRSGAEGTAAVPEGGPIRPLCDRYEEQIAEDVVQDIIDEVDFEVQDALEEMEKEDVN